MGLYLESCYEITKDYPNYDYVLTSPPDYAELGIDPKTGQWEVFLDSWMSQLKPKKNLVTICTTDRKADGKIYPKHIKIINVMEDNGWFLKSKKIWVKSYKVNMFRMNYMNILTFAKKPFKVVNPHDPDVFFDDSSTVVSGFKYGMSLDVCRRMIVNCTEKDDVVYDPFMGSGTTAVAAIREGRGYQGAEINEPTWLISKERVAEELNKPPTMEQYFD
tara:strand:- start:4339 stop:4992 length:654 start_codon:yes stop_codon:yes gene_type:complete